MAKHALVFGIEDYEHLEGLDLEGPRSDAIAVANLLIHRFGFEPGLPRSRWAYGFPVDRDYVIAAFDELCERVEKDTDRAVSVVVFYSGHGARLAVDGHHFEALVPSDSGRPDATGKQEQRYVFDLEVQQRLDRLRARTDDVVLILDCCHAGSVDRAAPSDDSRPDRERLLAAGLPADALEIDDQSRDLLRGRPDILVLSACRAEEKSKQMDVRKDGSAVRYGVFSYHLVQNLLRARSDATWRSVFEATAPQVMLQTAPSRDALGESEPRSRRRLALQHPQIDGPWERPIFGGRSPLLEASLLVVETDGDRLTLNGGLECGVAVGAVWNLRPVGMTRDDRQAPALLVEIESVTAGEAVARRIVPDAGQDAGRPEIGMRAFLRRQRLPRPGLSVAPQPALGESFRDRVASSSLLRFATDDPDLRLVLEQDTWLILGRDGRPVAAPRIAARHGDGGPILDGILGDLEHHARFRGLVALHHPAADNAECFQIDLDLYKERDGRFVDVAKDSADGLPHFPWGSRLDIGLGNPTYKDLYVHLLLLQSDGSVSLLFPDAQTREASTGFLLRSTQELRVFRDVYADRDLKSKGQGGEDRANGFPVETSPAGSTEETAEGIYYLRLVVAAEPLDLRFLESGALDPGPQDHPAAALARLYTFGRGTRDVDLEDLGDTWSIVSKGFLVGGRRTP